jgi:BMFP domain-containing protein YqiC
VPHGGAHGSPRCAKSVLGLMDTFSMIDKRLFEDLNQRVNEALRNSPAGDIEKNLRALLAGWFDRLDLVTREDFDVQKKLLERAQGKLAELEARLAELERARTRS